MRCTGAAASRLVRGFSIVHCVETSVPRLTPSSVCRPLGSLPAPATSAFLRVFERCVPAPKDRACYTFTQNTHDIVHWHVRRRIRKSVGLAARATTGEYASIGYGASLHCGVRATLCHEYEDELAAFCELYTTVIAIAANTGCAVGVRQDFISDASERSVVGHFGDALPHFERVEIQLNRLRGGEFLFEQFCEIARILDMRVEKRDFSTCGRELHPTTQIVFNTAAQALPHDAQEIATRAAAAIIRRWHGLGGGRTH